MVSTSFRAAASVIVISAFAIAGVHAATDNGRFAIEGAGLATCAAFTQARQARNPEDKNASRGRLLCAVHRLGRRILDRREPLSRRHVRYCALAELPNSTA